MMKNVKNIYTAFFTALLFMVFAVFVNKESLYYMSQGIDNVGMSLVTNRLIAHNNYNLYTNPLLSFGLGIFSDIFKNADAFAVYCVLSCFFATWFLLYYALSYMRGAAKYFVVLLVYVISAQNISHTNYTEITMFLTISGLIPLMHIQVKDAAANKITVVLAVLFITLGCMLRSSCVVIAVPFAVLNAFFTIRETKKYKNLLIYVPAVVCVLTVYGINYAFWHTSGRIDSYNYNNARVNVQDYPFSTDVITPQMAEKDITKNDLIMLSMFMAPDTDRIDTGYFNTVYKGTSKKYDISNVKIFYSTGNNILVKFTLLLAAAALAAVLTDKNIKKRLEGILAFLGMLGILFFFMYMGRLPQYVFLSTVYVCMAELAVVMDNMVLKYRFVFSAAAVFSCVFVFGYYLMNFAGAPSVPAFTARNGISDTEKQLETTLNGDELFLWDTEYYSMKLLPLVMSSGKLPSAEMLKHHTAVGGWFYGLPSNNELYDSINITNPIYDLLYRGNTHFVTDDARIEIIYNYYVEHIDPDVSVECIGEIYGIKVWNFYPGR